MKKNSGVLKILLKLDSAVAKAEITIASASIMVACVISMYTITMRNLGENTADWVLTLPIMLMTWATFAGVGYNISTDSHIKTDFFIKKLPKQLQKAILVTMYLMLIVISVMISYFGVISTEVFIRTHYKLYEMFYTPFYIVFLILPVSAALWCFHLIVRIFREIMLSETGDSVGI